MASAVTRQDRESCLQSLGSDLPTSNPITIGVLALQGAFTEHLNLLTLAASSTPSLVALPFQFLPVRTPAELARCAALILPGGESTAISLIAERTQLLDPLRAFVKVARRPVWGTCAGLILLAERADRTKASGQELIGGLDVRVQRNYFGRQVESFEAELDLPFLNGAAAAAAAATDGNAKERKEQQRQREAKFPAVFIRAPVVQEILAPSADSVSSTTTAAAETLPPTSTTHADAPHSALTTAATVSAPSLQPTTLPVQVLARLPGRAKTLRDRTATAATLGENGDIVAVRQGNVFGTAFHPELTGDARIHAWWLGEVVRALDKSRVAGQGEEGR